MQRPEMAAAASAADRADIQFDAGDIRPPKQPVLRAQIPEDFTIRATWTCSAPGRHCNARVGVSSPWIRAVCWSNRTTWTSK